MNIRSNTKATLLLLLAAAAAGSAAGAGACPAGSASGERGCPSCNGCFENEADALTLRLTQESYDSVNDITDIAFTIGPARGCAYASLSMQLKAGLASLPVLASPEGVGVLPLPTFNSDCSDATGLKFTLTWDMTNTVPDEQGRYVALLRLSGKKSVADIFQPLSKQHIYGPDLWDPANKDPIEVTPLKGGFTTDDTYMGVLLNAPGTTCGRAATCAFSIVVAGPEQQTEYKIALTKDSATATSKAALPASTPSDMEPLPFYPTPQPKAAQPQSVSYTTVYPDVGSQAKSMGTLTGEDYSDCPDAFRVWEPSCYKISPACPSCWSSAKLINPQGSVVTVTREYNEASKDTVFTFNVRWGNIGCAQFATSMLPVRSLCRMKKFVVPLVPGVEPTNVGFLRPLVSKATARDAVQQQKGCDDATDTGLTNTITWHMDQVDPAVLEDLVAKGGNFGSLVFQGDVSYQDVFAQLSDATFLASHSAKSEPGLVATPGGSLAFYTVDDTNFCANGYYQYAPPPVDHSATTDIINRSVPSGGTDSNTTAIPILPTDAGNGTSGGSVGATDVSSGATETPDRGSGTINGGVSGSSSNNTHIHIQGVGYVPYTIDPATGTVEIAGIGEFKIQGQPGAPGYVTIPGIGDVFIPGYMIPTPSGLMDPSSSASLLNGHTPVSAIGYIVIDHAMCAGDLTVEAVVSGELAPILRVDPQNVTTQLGQVAKLAVSLAGKTMEDSYNGFITLTYQSADPACTPAAFSNMVAASPLRLTQGSAVVSMTKLPLSAASNGAVVVAVALDVMSTTTSGVRTEVLAAMLSLRQALDPAGSALAWPPGSSYCAFSGVVCDQQGAVVSISLPRLGLNGTLPTSSGVWELLSSVVSLDLSGNQLTGSIPPALSLLSNAASINLNGNALSGAVPTSLAALSPAATLDLSGNSALCGGLPRSLMDGLQVAVDGTGLTHPCFASWTEVRLGSTSSRVAVGPGLQLTTTAEPNPTLLEGFDPNLLSLSLAINPQVGGLSLNGSPLGEGQKFSWADLVGGALDYTPKPGSDPAAALPDGTVDSFVVHVDYDGAPAADMAFAMASTKDAGGFPASAQVTAETANGPQTVDISQVVVGDSIQAVCGGSVCYDEVYLIPFQQIGTRTSYLQLATKDGNSLRLAGSQYLPASPNPGITPTLVQASTVQPGQFIWVTDPANDKVLVPSEVTQASRVTLPGHIMPLTLKGTLLVDAADVSAYHSGSGIPEAMEGALAKVRDAYMAMKANKNSQTQSAYMAAATAAAAALGSGEVAAAAAA